MSLEDLVERTLAEVAQDMSAVPDVTALVARGMRARRRRMAIVTSVVATVVIVAVAISPILRKTAEPAPVSRASSVMTTSYPTTTIGPGRGTSYFLGSRPNVKVTFTMPADWQISGVWVFEDGSELKASMAFIDAANIYTDGCRFRLVDPVPGPSVADLVAAYAKVPGSEPAQDVTIGGYAGQQIQVKVPDYDPAKCKEGKFGILQHDNESGLGDRPSFGPAGPGGTYKVSIIDVNGTRLVIFVDYPAHISTKTRTELDDMVDSIEIG